MVYKSFKHNLWLDGHFSSINFIKILYKKLRKSKNITYLQQKQYFSLNIAELN